MGVGKHSNDDLYNLDYSFVDILKKRVYLYTVLGF